MKLALIVVLVLVAGCTSFPVKVERTATIPPGGMATFTAPIDSEAQVMEVKLDPGALTGAPRNARSVWTGPWYLVTGANFSVVSSITNDIPMKTSSIMSVR